MGLDNYYREIMDIPPIEDHEDYYTDDRMSFNKKGDWWSLTFATSFSISGSNHAR